MTEQSNYDKIQLEEGYRPNKNEEYMYDKHLAFFKQRLLDWKRELHEESAETVEHLKQEALDEPDLSDRATAETDMGLELRNRDRLRKLITQIDAALERIENGLYGYCEETGDEVILMKNKQGKVIGFEKLNYTIAENTNLKISLETAIAEIR